MRFRRRRPTPRSYNALDILILDSFLERSLAELNRRANQYEHDAAELSRAHADIVWQIRDSDNAHIGPQHRPGRTEHYEARKQIRQVAYFRSLGRPRGPYRR